MEKFIVKGGNKLQGTTFVSGSKNVALKLLVAACLTDEKVVINNIPHISDVHTMVEIIKELGGTVTIEGHSITVFSNGLKNTEIALEKAAAIRTSSMFLAPLLARRGKAILPNPGGCRIGKRPIDRTIEGLEKLGATITYNSEDGNFHATAQGTNGKYFSATTYRFEKSTHTGTETLLIASVLADGKTILENAAQEPEIDELIAMLQSMGAKIDRKKDRSIEIIGVEKLVGTTVTINPDRNEIVTFAIAAYMTDGDIFVKDARRSDISDFLKELDGIGAKYEERSDGIRFFANGKLKPSHVVTMPFPGFMTDWQGPWAVLMTKAEGVSTLHETVYESRFGYVSELIKMGAKIEFFNPEITDPKTFYNFNLHDDKPGNFHAIRISGPTHLHNGVLLITDLRAGATLVLGALAAKGTSIIFGVEHLDRGYAEFEKRINSLGGNIVRAEE